MYYISIEPVYSQGVGNYELITDNIDNVYKMMNELLKYKQTLDYDLSWEFYISVGTVKYCYCDLVLNICMSHDEFIEVPVIDFNSPIISTFNIDYLIPEYVNNYENKNIHINEFSIFK